MLRAHHLIVGLALIALPASGQYSINADSLLREYKRTKDPLARLDIALGLSRSTKPKLAAHYAAVTVRIADSLLAHGHAGSYDIASMKGSGLWNLGKNRYDLNDQVDSAFVLYRQARALWESIGNAERVLFADAQMAAELIHAGKAQESIPLFERLLIAHTAASDTPEMAFDHRSLAGAFNILGDHAHAIDHYLACTRLTAKATDPFGRYLYATATEDIGNIYDDLGMADTALAYIYRALPMYVGSEQPLSGCIALCNIAGIQEANKDTLGAIRSTRQAIALLNSAEEPEQPEFAQIVHSQRSVMHILEGDLDGAVQAARRGVDYAESVGYPHRQAAARYQLAVALHAAGMYGLALRAALSAKELADTTDIDVFEKARLFEELATIHTALGNSDEAVAAYQQWTVLRDSVESGKNRRKLRYLDLRKQMDADSLRAQAETDTLKGMHRDELSGEQARKRLFLYAALGVGLVAILLVLWLRHTRREKKLSEGVLVNTFPFNVLNALKRTGTAKAERFDQATILFTDFKGYAKVSASMTEEELHAELHAFFTEFDRIVAARGIEKIKTIGDSYMAAGGVPTPSTTHSTDVILAALEMQAYVKARKAERDAQGKPSFEMRVGVHTGPVVAGIVGVRKFQYDIWGDAVNTASRMESSGEVGEVNISALTYTLVKDHPAFAFTPRGKVEAKGKGEMEMYFVKMA